jgi:hypothetical protein
LSSFSSFGFMYSFFMIRTFWPTFIIWTTLKTLLERRCFVPWSLYELLLLMRRVISLSSSSGDGKLRLFISLVRIITRSILSRINILKLLGSVAYYDITKSK